MGGERTKRYTDMRAHLDRQSSWKSTGVHKKMEAREALEMLVAIKKAVSLLPIITLVRVNLEHANVCLGHLRRDDVCGIQPLSGRLTTRRSSVDVITRCGFGELSR